MDTRTHFMADPDAFPGITLCGLTIEAIILNDRPATCTMCHDDHASRGWTFPLPPTVTAVT